MNMCVSSLCERVSPVCGYENVSSLSLMFFLWLFCLFGSILTSSFLFYLFLFYYYSLDIPVCFLIRERKGVDLDGKL